MLEITTLGHRKRMISTLGRKPPQVKSQVSWVKFTCLIRVVKVLFYEILQKWGISYLESNFSTYYQEPPSFLSHFLINVSTSILDCHSKTEHKILILLNLE